MLIIDDIKYKFLSLSLEQQKLHLQNVLYGMLGGNPCDRTSSDFRNIIGHFRHLIDLNDRGDYPSSLLLRSARFDRLALGHRGYQDTLTLLDAGASPYVSCQSNGAVFNDYLTGLVRDLDARDNAPEWRALIRTQKLVFRQSIQLLQKKISECSPKELPAPVKPVAKTLPPVVITSLLERVKTAKRPLRPGLLEVVVIFPKWPTKEEFNDQAKPR